MRFHALLLVAALSILEARAQCPDCDFDGFVPPVDCDDGSTAIHPGASEICDGVDNDCDGHIDGLPGCDGTCGFADRQGADRRLNDPAVASSDVPAMVWTGGGYGVAWAQDVAAQSEIFFIRLDAGGVPIGPAVRVTNTANESTLPRLAWNGSGYGLTWLEETGVFFARLDAFGQRTGNDVAVGPGHTNGHAIVWTGSEYGVAWDSLLDGGPNSEIFFARLDRLGNAIGPALRVTNAPTTSLFPDLAWTGDGFGLDWYDLRDGNLEIYFTRLDADGTKIAGDVRLTNTPTHNGGPQIEWSGSEFGVVWTENGEIFFARLDLSGNLLMGLPLRVTNQPALSSHPALVRTGNGFGIVWYDTRDGNAEIYFQHVSAAGLLAGGPVRLTTDPSFADNPAVAWSGQGFGVAWKDNRLNLSGVYFARVGCGCLVDADGDGSNTCRDCDETRFDVHPGAPDACDALDQNCDGVDGADQDLDGASACTGDCDDLRPDIIGGGVEICDGRDNDCSGGVDDADRDGDGWAVCQDCNDADPAVSPSTREVCDGADNNCDGVVDDALSGPDADQDLVPGACDNCPVNANTDQTDRDQDGAGDACDLNDGMIWIALPNNDQIAWQPELGFDAFNEYRGDLDVLRASHLYTQDPATVPLASRSCGLGVTTIYDGPSPPMGKAIFYLVTGVRDGVEGSLGTDSGGQERPNDHSCP